MKKSKFNWKKLILIVLTTALFFASYYNIQALIIENSQDKKQQVTEKDYQNSDIKEIIIEDQQKKDMEKALDTINDSQQNVKKTQQQENIKVKVSKLQQMNKTQKVFQKNNLQPIPELDFDNLTQYQIEKSIKDRVQMGNPISESRKLRLWIIKGSLRSYGCALLNGVNILTPISISTIKKLIQLVKVGNVFVITDRHDQFAEDSIRQSFNQNLIKYYDVYIDSDYKFLDYVLRSRICRKIVYLSHNFAIIPQKAYILQKYLKEVPNANVYYTQSAQVNNEVKSLNILQQVDLQKIHPQQFNKFIYIFDQIYLSLITPLNFGFFAKYTIQEIIIFPLLAISQKYGSLKPIKQTIHQLNESNVQYKHFSLIPPQKQENSLCFISFPQDPSNESVFQLFNYLQNFKKVQDNTSKISLIIFLPYKFVSQKIQEVKFLQNIKIYQLSNNIKRLKIVIRAQKVLSSLSVYEGVYNFCPKESIIISSRHNIKLKQQFFTSIMQQVTDNSHYYWVNFIKEGKQIQLPELLIKNGFTKIIAQQHKIYFSSIQIFRSDLFKSGLLWNLKTNSLNFYQSELSFIKPMLEMISFNIKTINKTLINVKQRNFTQNQNIQNRIISQHFRQDSFPDHFLKPIEFNCLQNEGFSKYASQIIPSIIHIIQFKINNQQIQWSKKLQQVLKRGNQNFTLMTWRQEDINQKQFPLTYSFYARYIQLEQVYGERLKKLIIMLIKYEALYIHGGIYLDQTFNLQNISSLRSFLKFQIFFFNKLPYRTRQKLLQSDYRVMGVTQHNYYLKLVLNQLISQQKLDYMIQAQDHLKQSQVIINSMNEQELFTKTAFGMNLLK